MSLTEKEAQVIRAAIEDIRKSTSSMAAMVRNQAQDIATIGMRVQRLQENMQIVMSNYKPVPTNEIVSVIVEARQKINELENLTKSIKGVKKDK